MSETVTRAIELPLQNAAPEVWSLLRECWKQGAMLANWACHQLVKADCVRTPGMTAKTFPKLPDTDLYEQFTGIRKQPRTGKRTAPVPIGPGYDGRDFFVGAKASAQSIMQMVRKDWLNDRWEVLWHRKRSPRSYSSVPWPVEAKAWTRIWREDGKPCVAVTLPGGKAELRLRGGSEFGRQLALFQQMADVNHRRQLLIRAQRCSDSCHRSTITIGGVPHRVMVKMVADVPIREKPGNRTLTLVTDPNAFWVAELDGRQAWILNNDHWRRVVARHDAHLRTLQRMSEDAKAERRLANNHAGRQQRRLDALCHKDRNRLASFTHEAAANLVNYAIRQKVGEILYLDRDRGFIPKFPWHELHLKLAGKCQVNGIAFYSESQLRSSGEDSVIIDDATEVNIRPAEEDEKWTRIARLREMATTRLARAKQRKGSHPEVTPPSAP